MEPPRPGQRRKPPRPDFDARAVPLSPEQERHLALALSGLDTAGGEELRVWREGAKLRYVRVQRPQPVTV